jgi:hypothetical protein
MLFRIALGILTPPLLLTGCSNGKSPSPDPTPELRRISELYEPVELEILTATRPIDADGDREYETLLVVAGLYDDLGSKSRGYGEFHFELSDYRKASADRSGDRVGFWRIEIDSHADQEPHWDPAIGMYTFELNCPNTLPPTRRFVLSMSFEGLAGRRLESEYAFEVPRHPSQFGGE